MAKFSRHLLQFRCRTKPRRQTPYSFVEADLHTGHRVSIGFRHAARHSQAFVIGHWYRCHATQSRSRPEACYYLPCWFLCEGSGFRSISAPNTAVVRPLWMQFSCSCRWQFIHEATHCRDFCTTKAHWLAYIVELLPIQIKERSNQGDDGISVTFAYRCLCRTKGNSTAHLYLPFEPKNLWQTRLQAGSYVCLAHCVAKPATMHDRMTIGEANNAIWWLSASKCTQIQVLTSSELESCRVDAFQTTLLTIPSRVSLDPSFHLTHQSWNTLSDSEHKTKLRSIVRCFPSEHPSAVSHIQVRCATCKIFARPELHEGPRHSLDRFRFVAKCQLRDHTMSLECDISSYLTEKRVGMTAEAYWHQSHRSVVVPDPWLTLYGQCLEVSLVRPSDRWQIRSYRLQTENGYLALFLLS